MALAAEKLINKERFNGENALQFLLYLPIGVILMVIRIFLGVILWIASIILPNKWAVSHMLTTLACWTFGVYVKLKGQRDPRCSVLVANYVTCFDSLAAAHVFGTISLKRWKLPPFFASTLGIKNASQFSKKQHFSEVPTKPVLIQPESGPTNGKAVLRFTDWPFQIKSNVQPVAITVERAFTRATVQRRQYSARFPWRDAAWFLLSPATVYTLHALPPLRWDAGDVGDRCRAAVAEALQVEVSELTWDELFAGRRVRAAADRAAPLVRLGNQVKEVLPAVPLKTILQDLERTGSVDMTITNFLEGVTPYVPEDAAPGPQPGPSAPRYVTPPPTGTFPKTAKERQLSFEERKAQMIAEARRRYIEKHGLNVT